ncbi:MAG: glycosyltransferase [Methylococcaceae bacterium]
MEDEQRQMVASLIHTETPKILCLLQLPPPVHGVSQINAYIVSHPIWFNCAELHVTELNFANSIHDVGSVRLAKLVALFKVLSKQVLMLLRYRPTIAYFTFTPTGISFYRDLILLFVLKLFGVKNIYLHLHGKGIEKEVNKRPWLKGLYKFAFKRTQLILISPLLYFDIAKVAVDSQIHYLPNAIPATVNSAEIKSAMERRVTREVPQLVFLSNMILSKGPIELLKAVSILIDKGLRFKVTFSGSWFDDGCNDLFYSYVEAEGLSQYVEYIGPTYGTEKKELLLNGDIFVFPTYNDIFGIVNLEAMEAALPIVSTYEGAIPEIIVDGQTGFLVAKHDVAALADRLALLICDTELRIKMGLNGRKKFEEMFDFGQYVASLSIILLGVHTQDAR